MSSPISSAVTLLPPGITHSFNRQSPDPNGILVQFHTLLLSEVCKGSSRANQLLAADSPLSLAKQSVLEETFWSQVIASVRSQARWGSADVGEVSE